MIRAAGACRGPHLIVGLTMLIITTGCAGDDPAAPSLPVVDLSTLPEAVRPRAEEVQRAARRDPRDAAAAGELGSVHLAFDRPGAAAAWLDRARAIAPDRFDWAYLSGVAHEEAGHPVEAARSLERAIAIDGTYVPALVRLADLRLESDPSRARELYERAREHDPDDPAPHLGLARVARRQGDQAAAQEHLRRAVALDPDWAEARYALAMHLRLAGLDEEAEDHLKAWASARPGPRSPDPVMQRVHAIAPGHAAMQEEAMRLAADGRLEEAEAMLRRAIAFDPSGATARRRLGMVLLRQGRTDEAIGMLEEATARDPEDPESRLWLGRALAEAGRAEEAERRFREVIARHPGHAGAHVHLGDLIFRRGDAAAGIDGIRRGVALQPASGDHRFLLAHRLILAGDRTAAIEELRRCVALMPHHAGAHYTLGQLLMAAGDRAGARRAWEDAVAAAPSFAEASIDLAKLALQDGRAEDAIAHATRACEATGYGRTDALDLLEASCRAAGRACGGRPPR